jgi:hypothetical protein
MVSGPALTKALSKLMAMPFFPLQEPLVKMAVAEELPTIAATDEQLEWLIQRVTRLFNQWPGLSEIRAVYCSKFRPLDGVTVYSGVYPDGIPSERAAAPPPPALPPGHDFTADPEFENELKSLSKLKQFPGRAKMEAK